MNTTGKKTIEATARVAATTHNFVEVFFPQKFYDHDFDKQSYWVVITSF